jgi:phage repressor protein C with HTH and peptisase S24 domain
MPADVIPFPARAGSSVHAEFVVFSLAPAGRPQIPFGVMLLEKNSPSLQWKLRDDFDGLSREDAEYAALLDADFQARSTQMGGPQFLQSLEDSLSGFLRVSDRETATGSSTQALLNRLFEAHVLDRRVQPYVTHLPFYGLRAAATRFGEDLEVPQDESDVEWLRAPAGLRLTPEMFVVQVVGRSMEPLIEDGSFAIFRKFGAGSRQGKRLLIEELGATDSSARFTVKRYTSTKRQTSDEDGEWQHQSIRLEPLNPEFQAFELDPETFANRYRVLGEFVAVLPSLD